MSNGFKSLIKLTTYNETKNFIIYSLELEDDNEWHTISLRFSELKLLFKNVQNEKDNKLIKFPSSHSIVTVLKSILPHSYKQNFNQLRFQQLKTYFDNLSETVDLKNLPQFNSLLKKAKLNERQILNGPVLKPRNINRQAAGHEAKLSSNQSYVMV